MAAACPCGCFPLDPLHQGRGRSHSQVRPVTLPRWWGGQKRPPALPVPTMGPSPHTSQVSTPIPPLVLWAPWASFFFKIFFPAGTLLDLLPHQGLNPRPQQRKCRILTTRPAGNLDQFLNRQACLPRQVVRSLMRLQAQGSRVQQPLLLGPPHWSLPRALPA